MRCDAAAGRVTNSGSSFEIFIAATAPVLAEAMGVEVGVGPDESRMRPEASEVERLFASTEVARELFGWKPDFGSRDGFLRGLAETAEWFQDPANLAAYKTDCYNI